jgi:hypothetical protein
MNQRAGRALRRPGLIEGAGPMVRKILHAVGQTLVWLLTGPSEAQLSDAAAALGRHGAAVKAKRQRQTYEEFHNRLRAERAAGFEV